MVFRYEKNGVVWVDLERPSADELRVIAHEFDLGGRIEGELLNPTPLPTVLTDEHSTLLVLHFPTHGTQNADLHEQEVDFVVGRQHILTIRYEVVAPLHAFRKMLEASEALGGGPKSVDALLELLFNHLFENIRDHANHAAGRLEKIERDMFSGKERETVRSISEVNREFLHLEAAAANQEESLSLFLHELDHRAFFGSIFTARMTRILTERAQVARMVATHRMVATELRETNSALLNATQNEIMKTLTVITFIMLPLELIAGIFAMDTVNGMPLVHDPNGFWLVICIMVIAATVLTAFFTRKRWL